MKKLLASLIALSCLSGSTLLVSAQETVDHFNLELNPDWELGEFQDYYFESPQTIEGENFVYKTGNLFPELKPKPESGIECNANYLITGAYRYEGPTDAEIPPIIYTVVKLDSVTWFEDGSWGYSGGCRYYLGSISLSMLENARDLNAGDLIHYGLETEYCGNGMDIYGDDFIEVLKYELGFDHMANNSFGINPYEYVDLTYTIDEIIANAEAKKSSLQIKPVQPPLSKGDASGDNSINILDVIEINRAVLGKSTLTDEQSQAADVDGNGIIDAADSLLILKYLVGVVDAL